MQKKLRVLLGILILVITAGSAITVGSILPITTNRILAEIDEKLNYYGKITEEDINPDSDWMYISNDVEEDSNYTFQAIFEFFNVSDRIANIEGTTSVTYIFVPGELVFDIEFERIVLEYNEEEDYIVYGEKRMYYFNAEDSSLTGNEIIFNYNYLWPYYINAFGNGTEYGLQCYVSAFIMHEEMQDLQTLAEPDLTDQEIAHATLNRAQADILGISDDSTYLPHNWLSIRPEYVDLGFDEATSYQILFDATTPDGHDYSLLTGEAGSTSFFIDLVNGLDYDPEMLTIDPTALLASIYGIDTPAEIQYAKSLAAYFEYLAGDPALDWLYDHKISYITPRTLFEWMMGVPDPLLDNQVFPIIYNQTMGTIDQSTDIHYVEKLGLNNVSEVGELIAMANIPSYEYSQSHGVEIYDDFAYVVEGNRGLRIVNLTSSLFLGIGGYRRESQSYLDVAVTSDAFGTYAFMAAGTQGMPILDVTNPKDIEYSSWPTIGDANVLDLEFAGSSLIIANGEYGVTKASVSGGAVASSTTYLTEASAIAITTSASEIFVAEEGRGIEIVDTTTMTSLANMTALTNIYDLLFADDQLYVLDSVEGLVVFDYNDVSKTLTQTDTITSTGDAFTGLRYDPENQRLYVTQGDDGFIVLDSSLDVYAQYDSEGTAYDIYLDDGDVYLADGSEGLVKLDWVSSQFTEIARDELRTYAECWNQPSFVQFDDWSVDTDLFSFNETYQNNAVPPEADRGYSLRWTEYFFRPFLFDSSRDTGLYYDDVVVFYLADSQQPYLQLDQYDLYWQEDADYINNSFVHTGHWNLLNGLDWEPNDIYMTHSFPGSIRDEFHFQTMSVEQISGTIVERRDRVQYNTFATYYQEYYPYLNESVVDDVTSSKYQYRTWHQIYPKLTADMGTLFWQEDVLIATQVMSDFIKNEFLDIIATADSYRTGGAFGALTILTIGLVAASIVMNDQPLRQKKLE